MIRSTMPADTRKNLEFTKQVLARFAFLKKHGFAVAEIIEPTFVRYESPTAFVNIFHGRGSYEIGAQVGQRKDNLEFSIIDLVRFLKPEDFFASHLFAATTTELVQKGVSELAMRFELYEIPALIEDAGFLTRLQDATAKWSEQYSKEIRLAHIRPKAEAAFKRRDFDQVISLYEQVSEDLTNTELRKLEYARKQVTKKTTPKEL